jgi:hypothetical protein
MGRDVKHVDHRHDIVGPLILAPGTELAYLTLRRFPKQDSKKPLTSRKKSFVKENPTPTFQLCRNLAFILIVMTRDPSDPPITDPFG